MRINDINYGLYKYQNQVNRTNNVKDVKKTTTDDLEISSRGQELSQGIQSDNLERQKKVEQLKKQIAEGTYQMDSSKIAENLIKFWKK